MKNTFCCLALATSLIVAGGCRKQSLNTVERQDPIGVADYVDDKRIITDGSLNKIVRVQDVRQSRTPADVLKVQVDVLNTRNGDHRFNYLFEWYDMNGMLVETPLSVWRPMQIQGKERLSLVGVAPTPNAMDFRLKLQDSKGR